MKWKPALTFWVVALSLLAFMINAIHQVDVRHDTAAKACMTECYPYIGQPFYGFGFNPGGECVCDMKHRRPEPASPEEPQ